MNQYLTNILQAKRLEINRLEQRYASDNNLQKIMAGEQCYTQNRSLKKQLGLNNKHIIAEIKRHSPSKKQLATIDNPINIAEQYINGGAAAISILTDQTGFHGSLDDLSTINHYMANNQTLPLLRKDFILHPLQIAESILAGADIILLIAAILSESELKLLQETATQLGIDTIVEIHTQEEIQQAINCGASMISVNNRNLRDFTVDTHTALTLIDDIPEQYIRIAASGINSISEATQLVSAGYDGLLIGEALVKHQAPDEFIQAVQEAACHRS